MRRISIATTIAIALAVGALAAPSAFAAPDFYKGKTITVVIGYGPGGTYDKYARVLSEFMQRHIPGNPKLIVQYMPGAGGLKAANFAAHAMPKDGLHIIMPPDTVVVAQLMRPEKVRFDARKFTWLGSTNQTNTIMVVRTDSGIKSVEDLKTKEIVMGAVGVGSTSFMMPSLLKPLLGWKAKIISGYKGSSRTVMAVEQGEVQASSFNWLAWSSKVPHWFKDGFAKPILQLGVWKDPDLPNVPMARDLVAKKDLPLINFLASHGIIGRGFAMPPGVAPDKTKILTAAFAKTVADPEYVATAKKRRLRVIVATGAEVQKAVNDAFTNADKATAARARKLIFGK